MKAYEITILAMLVMGVLLAAAHLDMQDAMAKCQKTRSHATCHASLYR